MKILLHNQLAFSVPSLKDFQLIAKLIDKELGALAGQINLVFCDDDEIQELNKTYRSKDKVTDVLTFTYYCEPSLPPKKREVITQDTDLLGEIFISLPQTQRQASSDDWPNTILDQYTEIEMEVYKLCIHGMIHLRGYDHEKDEDYRVMKLLEEKIMKSFLESKKT